MGEKLTVVVTDYVEPDLDWEAAEMAKRGLELAYYQLKTASEDEVIARTRQADIIVVNMVKITSTLIDAWEKCKLVIRHGAGYDNVDVKALTRRGIVWSGKVVADSIARGEWDFRPMVPMFRIDGRTVGIIGCGRIGSMVYSKLRHFGVKFLICDPYLPAERNAEFGIETVDLETLCRGSDFVTVHTPLNDETRHMINAKTLSWMKPTAYLINTSRGGMVDHEALADALKSGQIAGAAIDVYDLEPPKSGFLLLNVPNVILTPHISWYSKDSEWSIREKIVQVIDMFLDGTGPRMPVNPEALEVGKDG